MGHPCKFQRLSRLDSVTARQSSSGRQPNFAALNRGRHLYLAGRPSRWAFAHILVLFSAFTFSTFIKHLDTYPRSVALAAAEVFGMFFVTSRSLQSWLTCRGCERTLSYLDDNYADAVLEAIFMGHCPPKQRLQVASAECGRIKALSAVGSLGCEEGYPLPS